MRREIHRRIRDGGPGWSLVADIDAVISINGPDDPGTQPEGSAARESDPAPSPGDERRGENNEEE